MEKDFFEDRMKKMETTISKLKSIGTFHLESFHKMNPPSNEQNNRCLTSRAMSTDCLSSISSGFVSEFFSPYKSESCSSLGEKLIP